MTSSSSNYPGAHRRGESGMEQINRVQAYQGICAIVTEAAQLKCFSSPDAQEWSKEISTASKSLLSGTKLSQVHEDFKWVVMLVDQQRNTDNELLDPVKSVLQILMTPKDAHVWVETNCCAYFLERRWRILTDLSALIKAAVPPHRKLLCLIWSSLSSSMSPGSPHRLSGLNPWSPQQRAPLQKWIHCVLPFNLWLHRSTQQKRLRMMHPKDDVQDWQPTCILLYFHLSFDFLNTSTIPF